MYSLFGLLNDNIGSSFCCNLVDWNINLGTFLTMDLAILSKYYGTSCRFRKTFPKSLTKVLEPRFVCNF